MKTLITRFSKSPATYFLAASLALAAFAGQAYASSVLDDGISAYRHGEFEKSAQVFTPLADQGNATAQYLLSCQMINGVGVKANEDAGWTMMKASAGNKNPDASIVMARKLEATGAPADLIRTLYQQAADQGQTQAMLWLSLDALDQGKTDPAKEYLTTAWEAGDPRAATLLANRFAASDTARYQYLRQAAERGEMRAAAYLAEEAKSLGDPAEAVGWCAIATGLPGHNEDVDWKTLAMRSKRIVASLTRTLNRRSARPTVNGLISFWPGSLTVISLGRRGAPVRSTNQIKKAPINQDRGLSFTRNATRSKP
ncbi:tetratricopeptide repeat protein [Thalassospira lucentensis]|uniref:tetratricopeptide repeat protein n=1 Tax=Thalassospira lucentensis TaxID=168935 RepID=UPI00399D78F6